MAKTNLKASLGAWAFLIGVIVALIAGAMGLTQSWIVGLLAVAGIVVGLFNVTDKESSRFLLAAVSLCIVAYTGGAALQDIAMVGVGKMLAGVLNALLILFVPTTVIVALKSVFDVAKN
ncbi:MAG: hypothetical protein WC867_07665 [Candidatus Pacearchaeota archaeon]|jgi:hypothetical protein